jgi:hypothetical protein
MAVVHEKRGNKQVPHYFHTLKEKDGSSKQVYLGSDAYKARKRIVQLHSARLKHDDLHREAEQIKHRLNKIAEHGKPAESKLQEVRQAYYAQKHYDKVLEPHRTRRLESAVAVVFALAAVVLLLALFSSPTITGVSVLDSKIDWNYAITNPFAGTLITIVLLAMLGITILHAKVHLKKKRLEKFVR